MKVPAFLTFFPTAESKEENRVSFSFPYDQGKGQVKIPINVEFPEVTRTVYSGNTLYGVLEYCVGAYGDSNAHSITAQNLDRCFQIDTTDHVSLADSGYEQTLHRLARNVIYAATETPAELKKIEDTLNAASDIQLQSKSTDGPVSRVINLTNHLFGDHSRIPPPDIIRYYSTVYGVSPLDYPSSLGAPLYWLVPDYQEAVTFDPQVTNIFPHFVMVTRVNNQEIEKYYHFSLNFPGQLYSPEEIQLVYSFVKHHETALDRAAEILNQHHSSISLNSFRSVLYGRMAAELCVLAAEDPWQDAGAAALVNSLLDFATPPKPVHSGFEMFGRSFDVSWKVASLFFNLERQAFGPMQVISGLAREAAADQPTLTHWEGVLSAEDFSSKETTVKTCLEKSVYCYGLCLDYILTKLEGTLFVDSTVRTPRISVYSLQDPQEARAQTLLTTAMSLVAYPERDGKAKEMVTTIAGSSDTLYYFWDNVFGIQSRDKLRTVITEGDSNIEFDFDHDGQADMHKFFFAGDDLGSREALKEASPFNF